MVSLFQVALQAGGGRLARGAERGLALGRHVRANVRRHDRLLGNDKVAIRGGMDTFRKDPVAVENIADAGQVSVGSGQACALRAGGTVLCWGENRLGQVGDGTIDLVRAPTAVLVPRTPP